MIFLSLSLIAGAGAENPPIERLRETQRPQNLRLLIDLYHAHDLAGVGGIHWRSIRQEFTRQTVGEHGSFVIWGFESGDTFTWTEKAFAQPHAKDSYENIRPGKWRKDDAGWTVFWAAWQTLVDLGLVEIVGTLIEADTDTAAVIYPYGVETGEPSERALAVAAHDAAAAMLQEWQVVRADGLHLAPIRRHVADVTMVGIARLRYHPKTAATQIWLGKMKEWDEVAAQLDAVRVKISGESPRRTFSDEPFGSVRWEIRA